MNGRVDLAAFFRGGDDTVTIVSPFIKRTALERACAEVDPCRTVGIFTRWLPIEVALGVSDLSVYDWAMDRGNTEIFLLRELHAKAYITGERAVVGSANLTGRGMGWVPNCNLELLVEVPRQTPEVAALMDLLLTRAMPATSTIRKTIAEAAERIGDQVPLNQLTADADLSTDDDNTRLGLGPAWTPKTAEPRRLFDAYAPAGGMSILKSTQEDAEQDLAFLQVPSGYDRQRFIGHIRAVLMQSAVFRVVDSALAEGEDPGSALEEHLGFSDEEAERAWTIVADWLLYFFRDRYRVEAPPGAFRIVRSRAVE